jgi:hypothetical protein
MTTIIYSKNRAMQLGGLLTSMEMYFPWSDEIFVIYKCTTDEHWESYRLLKMEWPDVTWAKQQNFKDQTEWILSQATTVCFLMDDCLFFKRVTERPVPGRKESISHRLGENTVNKSHFNYTISLDGNVFRAGEFLECCKVIQYNNPNELEGRLVPYQANFKQTITEQYLVGLPHNRVSDSSGCKYSGRYTDEYLLEAFMEGDRIWVDQMDFSKVNGPHNYNIKYEF